MVSSSQAMLLSNISQNQLPKDMILNLDFSGKDWRNRIKAFLAWAIRFPCIDPDRSKMNMYSPSQVDMLSSTLDCASLSGINDIWAAEGLVIIWGLLKFLWVNLKMMSFAGIQGYASLRMTWLGDTIQFKVLCCIRSYFSSYSVVSRSIQKVQLQAEKNFCLFSSTGNKASQMLLRTDELLLYLGEIWDGIFNIHSDRRWDQSYVRMEYSMVTVSLAGRFPIFVVRMPCSHLLNVVRETTSPPCLASLNSMRAAYLSLTTPATLYPLNVASSFPKQQLVSVGNEKWRSTGLSNGLTQTCWREIVQKLFLTLILQSTLTMGTSILWSSVLNQHEGWGDSSPSRYSDSRVDWVYIDYELMTDKELLQCQPNNVRQSIRSNHNCTEIWLILTVGNRQNGGH